MVVEEVTVLPTLGTSVLNILISFNNFFLMLFVGGLIPPPPPPTHTHKLWSSKPSMKKIMDN